MTDFSDKSEGLQAFCANTRCALHVPHEPGRNWAKLPDGLMFSRAELNGQTFCDACLSDPERPVALPDSEVKEQ